jgi:protein-disulfide isomerase
MVQRPTTDRLKDASHAGSPRRARAAAMVLTRRTLLAAVLCNGVAHAAGSARPAAPLRAALRPGPLTPMLGAQQAPRVLAVYFDYHCPYCRAADGLLRPLAGRNPDLQILYREYPVLREDSELAARIALSAQLHGRFFEAHDRLMHLSGNFTGAVATQIAQSLGLEPATFRHDMGDERVSAELRRNLDDAAALGIQATPTYVTAQGVHQGAVDLTQLQSMVDGA